MIEEAHIAVTRTARYYTLGAAVASPRELWFVCHGYGQLAGYFVRHFEPLADGTRMIVAPEALSRFYFGDSRVMHGTDAMVGATWMTREDREREIEDHVRYLDTLFATVRRQRGRARARVTVLGFSQGVATVCRWLARGTARADRLVLWGGRMPTDIFPVGATSPLRSVSLTLVVGATDEYITPLVAAEQEALLRDQRLAYEVCRFDGGHTMDAGVLEQLAGVG
ncbi:MAG: alpha/beta hydrolase [Gemmatimonadaceae bacterium]